MCFTSVLTEGVHTKSELHRGLKVPKERKNNQANQSINDIYESFIYIYVYIHI